jgi:hypothetical protein
MTLWKFWGPMDATLTQVLVHENDISRVWDLDNTLGLLMVHENIFLKFEDFDEIPNKV